METPRGLGGGSHCFDVASIRGGVVSTGGGVVSTGGGMASTGGGMVSTGGGVVFTGGGVAFTGEGVAIGVGQAWRAMSSALCPNDTGLLLIVVYMNMNIKYNFDVL